MSEIIIIGPAYPLRGGIANFNEALCRTLIQKGHSCSIVSFTLQYPGFLFPGTSQKAAGDSPPGNIVIDPIINSINPISWWRAASFIRKKNPEFIIVRYWLPFMAPCLGTIIRLFKRNRSAIKIVAIADNIIPHENRPGDKALTRYFVNSCDAFLVMSQSVLDDLKKFDAKKPAILQAHPVYDIFGDPVDQKSARETLKLPEGNLVLFFGFIRHYKGLDLLLQAMAEEKVKEQDVKLVIAGEFYDDKQPYLDLIDELGISDKVILHDKYIPKQDVKNYFCASDLVVQPYRDATQSGVTQIAYHFGKPMVVTDVGGLAEIVPDGIAGYVTEVTPTAIAEAMTDFFSNNRSESMTEGVQLTAKKFSWEVFANKIIEFAEKLK